MPTMTRALTLFAVVFSAGVAAAQDGGSTAGSSGKGIVMTVTELSGEVKAYVRAGSETIVYRIESKSLGRFAFHSRACPPTRRGGCAGARASRRVVGN